MARRICNFQYLDFINIKNENSNALVKGLKMYEKHSSIEKSSYYYGIELTTSFDTLIPRNFSWSWSLLTYSTHHQRPVSTSKINTQPLPRASPGPSVLAIAPRRGSQLSLFYYLLFSFLFPKAVSVGRWTDGRLRRGFVLEHFGWMDWMRLGVMSSEQCTVRSAATNRTEWIGCMMMDNDVLYHNKHSTVVIQI